jgi:hypothetical protein
MPCYPHYTSPLILLLAQQWRQLVWWCILSLPKRAAALIHMAPGLSDRRSLDSPRQHPLPKLPKPLTRILKRPIDPLRINSTTPQHLSYCTCARPDRTVEGGRVSLLRPHVRFAAYYEFLLLGRKIGERVEGVHCSY